MRIQELLASAARTATTESATKRLQSGRGILLFINVTVAGTGGLTPNLRFYDPVSAEWFDFPPATQITATGKYLVAFTEIFGVIESDDVHDAQVCCLPMAEFRARVVHADGSSWTYSVAWTRSTSS